MGSAFRVRVDGCSAEKVAEELKQQVEKNETLGVATLNAEILLLARKSPEFRARLNRMAVTVVDGFGPWALLRIFGHRVSRVTGVDLVYTVCEVAEKKGARVLLLGGKKGSAVGSAVVLHARFPALRIEGIDPGIIETESDLLRALPKDDGETVFALLAFGAPKQEAFVEALLTGGHAQFAMGIGGALEMISGKLPRAPRIIRFIGLESLWRLALEPRRFPRIVRALVVFPFFFLYDSVLGNHAL